MNANITLWMIGSTVNNEILPDVKAQNNPMLKFIGENPMKNFKSLFLPILVLGISRIPTFHKYGVFV